MIQNLPVKSPTIGDESPAAARVSFGIWATEHQQPFIVSAADIADWREDLAAMRAPLLPFPQFPADPEGWQDAGMLRVPMLKGNRDGSLTRDAADTLRRVLDKLSPGLGVTVQEVDPVRKHLLISFWTRTIH